MTSIFARRLEREWPEAFERFELTPPLAFMQRILLSRPVLLARELAAKLSIARSTAARALDFLIDKGYIERRTGKGYGNEKFIFSTQKAIANQGAMNEASGAVTTRLQMLLGSPEFAESVSISRGVRSALN